ncbi:MAG: flagellar biosynthesis protein FlhB [Desulfobulbaceae bacterium]|nr:EscU/YscU/HrcU family type III secretion system export apparatus switch protein [Desulfobulbus sp.]NLB05540.1 flagellar biosynthesis protein FlhB [Desulfobulbaceae bacterium]
MAQDTPKAKKAVALLYDRTTGAAPKVVASGTNLTAERILAAAREAGVHISEDPDLVELLARVPVGAPIPAELYQTVAQLLAFVYAVNARFKEKLGPMGNR